MTVTGIGGIFFRAKDPVALNEWYTKHLGMNNLHVNYDPWIQQKGPTVFSLFGNDDKECFGGSKQSFMLNFRVEDLDNFVQQLKAGGVKILKELENQEGVGLFASIEDPEGNRVELWQPE
jgi:glyoxylase I family protein